MKSPDHPTPSGDRTFARGLLSALREVGLGEPELVSRLSTRDGAGDADVQDAIFRAARSESRRLLATQAPALWLTYHSYYKAPDLLGPSLSRHWNIPYAIVEASRSRKRLVGPHARFAAAAEQACDSADVIFYLTERDRDELDRLRPPGQRLVHLRPFLDRSALAPEHGRRVDGTLRLLACAMFRPGDKMASYASLAAAMQHVKAAWRLTVIGDGPERPVAEAMFAPFGDRVAFLGSLGQDRLADHFRVADLLVWPGVGEAFGMVYLEAQAEGCPALAEDRPGVREVVRDGGWLVVPDDPAAFAAMIDLISADPELRRTTGQRARARIAADHLRGPACATLRAALQPLIEEPQR
jgi:glycosyltransferase involved in cell wall biosynthesis